MDIIIENVSKTFGSKHGSEQPRPAVDIPHLTVHGGEVLGLVGNNGAGKSTLFRLILDLIKADTGSVLMCDGTVSVDVSKTEVWKDWTGAFIDESFLIDYLTPDEYFQFIARLTDTPDDQLQDFLGHYRHFMADELLGQKKLIRTLSAGNKQKVGIMAAMLLRPQVLILDEPFNFLDPSSQNAIKHLLTEYNETTGATILVSSHNLQHTVDISHRIVLLERGKVLHDIDNRQRQAGAILENYFEQ